MSKLSGLYEGDTKNPNYDIGHFICIDPENFADLKDFKKNVGDVMREIKSSKSKRGEEILVPVKLNINHLKKCIKMELKFLMLCLTN